VRNGKPGGREETLAALSSTRFRLVPCLYLHKKVGFQYRHPSDESGSSVDWWFLLLENDHRLQAKNMSVVVCGCIK
jgi:hypothetical protein